MQQLGVAFHIFFYNSDINYSCIKICQIVIFARVKIKNIMEDEEGQTLTGCFSYTMAGLPYIPVASQAFGEGFYYGLASRIFRTFV